MLRRLALVLEMVVVLMVVVETGVAGLRPRVVDTQFPSEDVPIASVIVTEPPFNAPDDGSGDATPAFQAAIDSAAAAGGAVVYVPSGRYRFEGSLLVREKVILRGDWVSPERGEGVQGTVLMPVGGAGDPDGTPFLRLERGSGIRNLTIWYPNQSVPDVTPYPWTVHCNPATSAGPGDNTTIWNVWLVNPYRAIKIGPDWNELHYLRNVYGTPLDKGIWLSFTTDIGRIMNVHFEPRYWSQSHLSGSPDESAILTWTREHGEGLLIGRSDWEYVYDVSLVGYRVGVRIFRDPEKGSPNGVVYGLRTEAGHVGVQVDEVNGVGFIFTACTLRVAPGTGNVCVRTGPEFDSVLEFNTCIFGGNPESAVVSSPGAAGRLSFQSCTFEDWSESRAAIDIDQGSLAVFGCKFAKRGESIRLGQLVTDAQIVDNRFEGAPGLHNESNGEVQFSQEDLHLQELDVPPHRWAPEPRPASDALFVVSDYGAAGDGKTDDTQAFQRALEAAAQTGGTVYVPAGWYKIAGHLRVPTGVELRGIWDVPHHTVSQGTVLLVTEGRDDPDGDPFIVLEPGSGIRGLSLWYPDQTISPVHPYPWAIRALGPGCWVKDLSLGNTYEGMDFASFPSDGHVISYVGGSPLAVGLAVGQNNGEGWVENLQFNPHYWMRAPGYPAAQIPPLEPLRAYQQANLEAFRFGACQEEHILGTFVYAASKGLFFADEGAPCRADVFLHGTDAASHGVRLECPEGSKLNFINSQLVILGATPYGEITSGPTFAGQARFYGVLAWGEPNGPTTDLRGSGKIQIEQIHTHNHQFRIEGGRVRLVNVTIAKDFAPQYVVGADVGKVEIYGSWAKKRFAAENHAGNKLIADYNKGQFRENVGVRTGWEDRDPANDWENALYSERGVEPASGKTVPLCTRQHHDDAHGGEWVEETIFADSGSDSAKAFFKILGAHVPVLRSTFLSFWVKPLTDLGRRVFIDLLFDDGSLLSERGAVAGDSLLLSGPRGSVGEWTEVRCAVGQYAEGQVVQKILVAYRGEGRAGEVRALIDDLTLEAEHLVPPPWGYEDIGPTRLSGYTVYQKGTFRLRAVGSGMVAFLDDSFHFVFLKSSGDVTITAKLETVEDLGGGCFAGLMVRSSDSSKAAFGGILLLPRYGLFSKWRARNGGTLRSRGHRGFGVDLPIWLRVEREGDSVRTFATRDSANWGTPLATVAVSLDSEILVGLAAAAGLADKWSRVVFSHVSVKPYAVTEVLGSDATLVPRALRLYPVFPNPFNSVATLRVDLPAHVPFELCVFNSVGRKVRTLADGRRGPGSFRWRWDGRDDAGHMVASGVYYCTLEADSRRLVRKVVLLR